MRLLETMRAEGGEVGLLPRHLARLAASAEAFGIPLDVQSVRERVASAIGTGVEGVRLTVGRSGDAAVTTWPLDDAPFRTVWIDTEPFEDAGTWRCTHKTTDRDHYRRRFDRARAHGADEALLVDLHGEVVEGTRTSVWIRDGDRLWTPHLAAGGLPGVMRAHLLATRTDTGEDALRPDDLRAADAIYLSNALRGWMPVRLVE